MKNRYNYILQFNQVFNPCHFKQYINTRLILYFIWLYNIHVGPTLSHGIAFIQYCLRYMPNTTNLSNVLYFRTSYSVTLCMDIQKFYIKCYMANKRLFLWFDIWYMCNKNSHQIAVFCWEMYIVKYILYMKPNVECKVCFFFKSRNLYQLFILIIRLLNELS